MKKKILIIITVILIILVGIFIVKKINTEKYNYEIDKVEEYNYYISQENELYGIIDKEGKKSNRRKIYQHNITKSAKGFICML